MRIDVVVVGGGAIGASVALELTRRGRQVMLIERGADLGSGCSRANAGFVGPGHAEPLANPEKLREGFGSIFRQDGPFHLRPRLRLLPWLARFVMACGSENVEASRRLLRALTLESVALHTQLANEGIGTGLERCGRLEVYSTEAGFAAGLADAERYAESTRLGVRVLDPSDALALEPALREGFVGAIHYPDEISCDPKRFVDAVAAAAARAGAVIHTGVEVVRVRRSGPRLVLDTTLGELRPETTVLAAGAWSGHLLRRLGIRLSLEGGKGYSIDVGRPAGSPAVPVYLNQSRTIATPITGRLRLVGMLVLSGLDFSVSGRRVDSIMRAAASMFHGARDWRPSEIWCGLRPCTPDGLPVIGSPSELEGLVLATGHGMHGLQLAPVTGRLVAQLLSGEPPSHDLTPLLPDRFGLLRHRIAARRLPWRREEADMPTEPEPRRHRAGT